MLHSDGVLAKQEAVCTFNVDEVVPRVAYDKVVM